VPIANRRRCRIHYDLDGEPGAPPLLMLRGLARSARHWSRVRPLLVDRFRLVLVDNRGVGRSDAPLGAYTTGAMADDAVAVLDDAGVDRAHVFGMSLGGMIAQQVALRHPGRVDRLILGCTTPGGRRAVRIPLRSALTLLGSVALPLDRALALTAPLVHTPAFLERDPEAVATMRAIAIEEGVRRSGVLGQIAAAALHDAFAELARIDRPTLVVTGDADRIVPPVNSEILAAAIPGARVHIMRGVGHDFATERPAETAALIAAFLLT